MLPRCRTWRIPLHSISPSTRMYSISVVSRLLKRSRRNSRNHSNRSLNRQSLNSRNQISHSNRNSRSNSRGAVNHSQNRNSHSNRLHFREHHRNRKDNPLSRGKGATGWTLEARTEGKVPSRDQRATGFQEGRRTNLWMMIALTLPPFTI